MFGLNRAESLYKESDRRKSETVPPKNRDCRRPKETSPFIYKK